MRRIAVVLACAAALLGVAASPAGAVTVVVHMYGPGQVKDIHAGGTLSCTTPESRPASVEMDCAADYGAFSGPEIQASVPGGWAGGQRFVGSTSRTLARSTATTRRWRRRSARSGRD